MSDSQHDPLFVPVSQTPPVGVMQLVTVDREKLLEAIGSTSLRGPDKLRFNLPDNTDIILAPMNIQVHDEGIMSWYGAIHGEELETYAMLSIAPEEKSSQGSAVLIGIIAAKTRVYSICLAKSGYLEIRREVSTLEFAHKQGLPTDLLQDPIASMREDGLQWKHEIAVIHALVPYSPAVEKEVGGPLTLALIIRLLEALTNMIFVNSEIQAKIVLLPRKMHDWTETDFDKMHEALGMSDDLAPKLPTKPELVEELNKLLIQENADVVTILMPYNGMKMAGVSGEVPEPPKLATLRFRQRLSLVGIKQGPDANFMNNIAAYVYPHELGHLLGARHDSATDYFVLENTEYGYVRGYKDEKNGFSSMMAYPDGTYLVPAHSSVAIKYQGKRLGVPRGHPNAADAVPFLRLSTRVVASYKDRFDPSGLIDLNVSADPDDGAGSISTGAWGPYREGQHVTFFAVARHHDNKGYRFDHWKLGERRLTDQNPITLTIGSEHAGQTLKACFILQDSGDCTITVDKKNFSGQISLALMSIKGVHINTIKEWPDVSQKSLPFGSSVLIKAHWDLSTLKKYVMTGWEIDDEFGYSRHYELDPIKKDSGAYPLMVRLYKDMHVVPQLVERTCKKVKVRVIPQDQGEVTVTRVGGMLSFTELESSEMTMACGVPAGAWCLLRCSPEQEVKQWITNAAQEEGIGRTDYYFVKAPNGPELSITAKLKGFENACELKVTGVESAIFQIKDRKWTGSTLYFSRESQVMVRLKNEISGNGKTKKLVRWQDTPLIIKHHKEETETVLEVNLLYHTVIEAHYE